MSNARSPFASFARRQAVPVLAILIVAGLLAPGLAPAATVVSVETTKLRLDDDSQAPIELRRRKIYFRAATSRSAQENRVVAPVRGGADDPTLHGAVVAVGNGAGSGEAVVHALPASGWRTVGSDRNPLGFQYRDDTPGAPVSLVVVRRDQLKVKGSGYGWDYTLDEPQQGRVGVRVTLGTTTWCAGADARQLGNPPSSAKSDRVDRFDAQPMSPPPASCPDTWPRVGTFLPAAVDATYSYGDCDIVREAQALGVSMQRVQQVADTTGLDSLVTALADAGIESHLTFKANRGLSRALLPDDPGIPGDENAAAGTTVTEFRRELGERLDEYEALSGGPAPTIAIENEANHDQFYDGTVTDYLAELRIAVEVAHLRGVQVTDSGIAAKAVKLVAWNHIRITGDSAAADAYLRTVFRSTVNPSDTGIRDQLLGVSTTDPDPYSHLANAELRGNWQDAEAMLAAYGAGPGQIPLDYVNFHWYTPDEPNLTGYRDRDALAATVDALAALTDLPVVTNEIGQHGLDVAAVSDSLDVVKARGLALAIWFDADGTPAHGLFEPTTPGQLRPNGEAFRASIARVNPEPSACD